jgi:hypothetical protein
MDQRKILEKVPSRVQLPNERREFKLYPSAPFFPPHSCHLLPKGLPQTDRG